MERYVIMMLFLCVFQQQFSKSTCQVCTTRFTSTERVFAQKYTGSLLTAESSLAVGRFTWSLKASPLQFLCSSFSMVQGIYNATCTAGSPCSRSTLYVTNLPLSDNGAQFSITGSDAVSVSTTITVKGCPNITSAGVVQDVPSTAGFNDVHTFTCLPNYSLSSASPSTCQANATWNPTPVCNAVCNTTTIPSNTSYVSPSTSELLVVGSSKDLTCTSGYIGSASAVCNAAGDTRSWTVTTGCKAVCSQLSADYCVHGTNTNVTTVTEGSDVNVGCCNGKSGSTTAVCATPGNITLSLDCSQAPRLWIGKFTFSSLQLLATLTIWINCNNFMF